MEQQYDNTNKGILFVNDRKKTERHPDFTGTININGVEHFLSGWKKMSKTGKPLLSLSIGKAKDVQPQQQAQPQQQVQQQPAQQQQDDMVNVTDIPF